MKLRIYMLLMLVCCLGCTQDQNEKAEGVESALAIGPVFDKTRWKTKNGFDYPYRNEMLEDLMSNQGLREMERDEILNLLGKPDRVDNNYLFYRVDQMRLGFFLLHTKTMVIQLAEDGTVNWIKIHE